MEFPGDLKYSGSDEWIKADGDTATLGVTDFAQAQLSDVVYFEIVAGVVLGVFCGRKMGELWYDKWHQTIMYRYMLRRLLSLRFHYP